MKQIFSRFSQDLISVGLLGVALFLTLSLLSYNPIDPSLNSIGKALHATNYCGLVGGFLADLLYHALGLTVWLLVFGIAKVSIDSFKGRESIFKSMRLLWASLLTLTVASLLGLNFADVRIYQQQIYLGGLVGVGFSKMLLGFFNYVGAQVLLVGLLILTTLIYFDKTISELLTRMKAKQNLLFGIKENIFNFAPIFKKIFLKTFSYSSHLFLKVRDSKLKTMPISSIKPDGPFLQINSGPDVTNEAEDLFKDEAEDFTQKGPEIEIDEIKFEPKRRTIIKTKIPNRIENWEMPKLILLEDPPAIRIKIDKDELRKKAEVLMDKLGQFSVQGQIVGIKPGPAVTMFEFKPNANVKVSKITELAEDLTLALSSESLRIIAPIPGRDVVGIETSNSQRDTVYFKDLLHENAFWSSDFKLPIALGRQASGEPRIVDLRKMPHLLIAGTTGSGKSVFTVALITGLLLKHSPKSLRLILIDPKQVDLAVFSKIPHLVMPPVKEGKKAISALKWAIREMEKRYRSMAKFGARGLEGFNETVEKISKESCEEHDKINQELEASPKLKAEQYYFTPQPYIVIAVEEFGDLMSVDKQNVEQVVVRLAQMARACGIHLILAMQSPRKEVVTGLIKANIPGRISFKVASKMDSRIILDESGAERLLAQGDMLFLAPGVGKPQRHHGPYLKESEIIEVAKFWSQQGEPNFDASAMKALEGSGGGFDFTDNNSGDDETSDNQDFDERYDEILSWAAVQKEVSASLIQRKFRLGYPRAARIIEVFEKEGVVGPASGSKPRQVLVNSLRG